jgi:hypothetical protein
VRKESIEAHWPYQRRAFLIQARPVAQTARRSGLPTLPSQNDTAHRGGRVPTQSARRTTTPRTLHARRWWRSPTSVLPQSPASTSLASHRRRSQRCVFASPHTERPNTLRPSLHLPSSFILSSLVFCTSSLVPCLHHLPRFHTKNSPNLPRLHTHPTPPSLDTTHRTKGKQGTQCRSSAQTLTAATTRPTRPTTHPVSHASMSPPNFSPISARALARLKSPSAASSVIISPASGEG